MALLTKKSPVATSRPANHGWSWLHLLLVLLILAAQVGAEAVAEPVTAANISEKIADAKTAADQEEIAVYYRSQASEADANIKVHEKMKQSYRAIGKSSHYERWHR